MESEISLGGESYGDMVESQSTKIRKRKARKQEEPWRKDECLELAMAVEAFSCIWNHTLAEYKDREARDMAWESIAGDLGRSKDDCKNKWGCMRVNFRTTANKMGITDIGQDVDQQLPDPYSAMEFLLPMFSIQPAKHDPDMSESRRSSADNVKVKIEPDTRRPARVWLKQPVPISCSPDIHTKESLKRSLPKTCSSSQPAADENETLQMLKKKMLLREMEMREIEHSQRTTEHEARLKHIEAESRESSTLRKLNIRIAALVYENELAKKNATPE